MNGIPPCGEHLGLMNYIRQPLFIVFFVTAHNTNRQPEPTSRQIPDHSWGPRKSVSPFAFFFSNAPAMGDPIRVAILETLHDIPRRVPRRDISGQMFAKAADGSVTSAADKNPAIFALESTIYS